MLKFNQSGNLYRETGNTLKRFPLSLCLAVIAVIVGMTMIYNFSHELTIDNFYFHLAALLTALLGLPLFFCIKVFSEINHFGKNILYLSNITGLLLLLGIFFSLPLGHDIFNNYQPYVRYSVISLCLHLAVAFAPFLNSKNLNGFWQYNRILFLRFVTATFFSSVIFTGISIALLILVPLFNINVYGQYYAYIAVITGVLFHNWFFLAGIPRDIKALEHEKHFPKGLRIFAIYILLPLLAIYMLILYTYVISILITNTWPTGIISYMIIAVAILGIFNLLLLYPYINIEKRKVVNRLYIGYFIFIIPLVVVLFIAIGMRISEYGITINRFIVVLFGAWLFIVSLFFIFSKYKNIKFIPVSIFCIFAFFLFGPWSMFSVSERSQVSRLEKILTEHNILQDGRFIHEAELSGDLLISDHQATEDGVQNVLHNRNDYYQAGSIIIYLSDYHSLNRLNDWFEQDLQAYISDHAEISGNLKIIYMKVMNLTYQSPDNDLGEPIEVLEKGAALVNYTFNDTILDWLNVSGYDYALSFSFRQYHATSYYNLAEFNLHDQRLRLRIKLDDPNYIRIYRDGELQGAIPVADFLSNLEKQAGPPSVYNFGSEPLRIHYRNDSTQVALQLSYISYTRDTIENTINQIRMRGTLLMMDK